MEITTITYKIKRKEALDNLEQSMTMVVIICLILGLLPFFVITHYFGQYFPTKEIPVMVAGLSGGFAMGACTLMIGFLFLTRQERKRRLV